MTNSEYKKLLFHVLDSGGPDMPSVARVTVNREIADEYDGDPESACSIDIASQLTLELATARHYMNETQFDYVISRLTESYIDCARLDWMD